MSEQCELFELPPRVAVVWWAIVPGPSPREALRRARIAYASDRCAGGYGDDGRRLRPRHKVQFETCGVVRMQSHHRVTHYLVEAKCPVNPPNP